MSRTSNNLPFPPARVPLFYGWVILAVGTLGILMSVPGQTMGVSSFTEHLLDALGLSREQLSLAYLFGTAASGLILTFAGKLYDRWGARVVATLSCIGLGAMLAWCSQSDRLARIGADWTGSAPTAWAFGVILLGFFGIRFFGQGVLTMVSRNMIMKWFDRHRGLANAIAGVGVSLGFSASPPILDELIQRYSWRGAWLMMAGIVGTAFAAFVLVFFRDNPEDCDLVPDGSLHDDEATVAARLAHRQFELREAIRTFSFWVFALGVGMFALYMTAMTFHVVSIFAEAGLGKDTALSIFFPASVLAVICHFSGGWISDYIPLRYLLAAMLVGIAVSMLAMMNLSGGTLWVLIAGNGLLGGMFGVVSAVTWPRFFGRQHLGAISGLAMAITVLASAIGPWLFSRAKAATGSYNPAIAACLAVTLALLVASFFSRNPQPRRPKPAPAQESPGTDRP